ncbi:AmmeMemoRadiSam system protein B [Hahella sp. CCB-MM4]|uniref:AmmeMemoRadiSam system protein B n=1 Tax=Hahella sp. (strain CCB-MM4) TaxID=1926491 RepID=UPI000B9B9FE7|nr:AmmeMemoRadiSam system protein B [Hahella sp. CCB-MM4]OZG71458.1 AmmeMemoRadiSam system protein B [Hahella sp. CCB-MM4]
MSIRQPAVEGLFYPANRDQLKNMISGYLSEYPVSGDALPKAIIVPHAGLVYSGVIAAAAYAQLAPYASKIHKVVLIGPSHRVAFEGLAVPESTEFATPLGLISIDQELKRRVLELPQVIEHEGPHAQEHSLEVQLPFLQLCLKDFELLPLVVGDASAANVSEVLELVWGGEETLIVASSDLSHYLDYESARRKDDHTSMRILNREYTLHGDEACGCRVLNGLLKIAVGKDIGVERLRIANSGDTAGDKSRVVGYGAYALH